MKLKIVLVLLFAGTVITSCGSTQSTGSDTDSTMVDTSMRQTAPVDTMKRDSVPTDTVKRDTVRLGSL